MKVKKDKIRIKEYAKLCVINIFGISVYPSLIQYWDSSSMRILTPWGNPRITRKEEGGETLSPYPPHPLSFHPYILIPLVLRISRIYIPMSQTLDISNNELGKPKNFVLEISMVYSIRAQIYRDQKICFCSKGVLQDYNESPPRNEWWVKENCEYSGIKNKEV